MLIKQASLQGRWLVMTLVIALLGACSNTAPPPAAPTAEPEFAPEYRIGVGDALNINVWRNADLSVQVPVRPDGKISVPLAGDVMVGGVYAPQEI